MFRHFLSAACALLLLCSCGKDNSLLSLVPAKADVVITLNGEAALHSAGASIDNGVIKLPSTIEDEIPARQLRDIEPLLELGCIDPQEIVYFSCLQESEPLSGGAFIFTLSDRKKFIDLIEEGGYEHDSTSGDYTVYYSGSEWRRSYLVIFKEMAVVYSGFYTDDFDSFDPIRTTTKWMDKARENSFASTKVAERMAGKDFAMSFYIRSEYLDAEELTATSLDLRSLRSSHAVVTASFEGNDAIEATGCIISRDGEQIDIAGLSPVTVKPTKINKEALAYLQPNEVMVLASSLKDVDWSTYLDNVGAMLPRDQRAMVSLIEPYISQIDGTITLGFGPTQGLMSFFAVDRRQSLWPDYFTVSVVIELKKDKAQSMIDQIEGALTAIGVYVNSDEGDISVNLGDFSLYAGARSNFIIFSTRPISNGSNSNPAFTELKWNEYCSACGLVLTPDDKLMTDLKLDDYKFSAVMYNTDTRELKMRATLTGGTAQGLLERFFEVGFAAAHNGEQWYNRHEDEIKALSRW